MTEGRDFPSPSTGVIRQVAIVGLNRETAHLLPNLLDAEGIHVIKVLNPELEDVSRLTQYPHLDIIIDTTHNPTISARLRKLSMKRVDVISGLGARILFCGVKKSGGEGKDAVLQSLEELREAVGLAKNKDEILKVILNTAVKTTGADCGSLMLLDPSKRQLTIEASVGLDPNVVLSAIQRVGKGVSGMAVRRGEAVLIQGRADKDLHAAEYQNGDLTSAICCPLKDGDEPVGVINISSKNPARIFGREDVEFLQELAGLTAEMIKSTRDPDTNQTTAHSLGIINAVREILSMKYRMEERLNLMLMKLVNAFGATACTYYEINPTDKSFVAKASSSVGVTSLKEKPMLLDDLFTQRILKCGHPFCVNATGKFPRTKKWSLVQPIRVGVSQEIVGALFLFMNSEKNNLKEETGLLKKIGEMLGREFSKSRELESMKVQSLKYSAISQFSFDVSNTASLSELNRMILSNLGLILEAETCVLRLRNSHLEDLEVRQTVSSRDAGWLESVLAVDEFVVADLSPGKGPLRCDDLSRSPYADLGLGKDSMLAAAIDIGGEIMGSLTVYNRKAPDQGHAKPFTNTDQDVLLNFVLQAAKGLKRYFPFPSPKQATPDPVLAD